MSPHPAADHTLCITINEKVILCTVTSSNSIQFHQQLHKWPLVPHYNCFNNPINRSLKPSPHHLLLTNCSHALDFQHDKALLRDQHLKSRACVFLFLDFPKPKITQNCCVFVVVQSANVSMPSSLLPTVVAIGHLNYFVGLQDTLVEAPLRNGITTAWKPEYYRI